MVCLRKIHRFLCRHFSPRTPWRRKARSRKLQQKLWTYIQLRMAPPFVPTHRYRKKGSDFSRLSSLVRSHWSQLELSRQNQRTNFVITNFCFFCCIRIKDFQSPQIPSAPDLFIRAAKMVCERFHLQFPGSIVILYKFQKSRVLQQKTIWALLVTWFQFNYTLVVAYTTNDWQVYHDVCLDTTSGLQSYYKLDIFKLFYKGYNATLPDSLPENILKCCSNGYSLRRRDLPTVPRFQTWYIKDSHKHRGAVLWNTALLLWTRSWTPKQVSIIWKNAYSPETTLRNSNLTYFPPLLLASYISILFLLGSYNMYHFLFSNSS